jgi:hypothetical protein
MDVIGQTYHIPYYELDKTLKAFSEDPVMGNFTVVTKFNTQEFADEKFKADAFEYSGSQFQALVKKVDEERMNNPTSSPPPKIVVQVDPKKKKIFISVGEAPEVEPELEEEDVPAKEKKSKKGKGKKEKAYKQIKASPSGIKKLNLTIKNNEAEIAELNRIIRREKDNVLPLLMGNTDLFKDFILESTGNIKEWTGKLKKLTNETEDLKKQLKKQDKGFANKKPNKRK